MPNNPFRLTIQWLNADAFPRCRVVIGNDPPRWDFGLISDWPIPPIETTNELAGVLDKIRGDMTVAYTADQLRVLAVQIRKAGNVPIVDAKEFPWSAGWPDPYGDVAHRFQCEYSGKAGTGTLLLWVAEIRVEN